ncbi:EAL domain-containing protein [Castellaniella sp.]|uniref:EAL domain-containing protein n=1 Tax=Castellaniella sp. TaxID=1955812 RepID=UPI002D7EEDCE|nr:EAL domain-containing protein [Castellaniella sp.]HET8703942.1 EAL domain-containing protein [Castellaniella sp.]
MASVRQLLVISSLVIACILVGMLAMGTSLMERRLDAQLQTDSENAAATLALLVRAQPDAAARTKVLDAAFQQGRFASLTFTPDDPSAAVFQSSRPGNFAGDAPDWFTALADIQPHQASRQIAGIGALRLTLDPVPARDALWTHVQQWTWLALGLAAFWALFVVALVSRVRRELTAAAAEAPEIKIKRTEPVEDAELMDDVRERVAPTMDEQMARIERLEIELNRDPVTGLANRSYFLNELKRMLRDDSRQGAVSGYVLLVRSRDMGRLQNETERQELDDWLRLLGRRIIELLNETPQARALPARLTGSDFVVLFPVGGGPEVMRPVQKLRELLETLRVKLDSHNLSRWAYALTDYTVQCTPKEILTRLDQALMCAESAGHEEVEFLSYADHEDGELLMGEASWRTLICQALDHDRLSLDVRRVQYEGDDIAERYEAALALREDDPDQPRMSGFLFMPAAARLGLSPACDMRALCLALNWLGEHDGILIIRMSVASILDAQYLDEIRQICTNADPELLHRLVVELDAYGLNRHLDAFRTFAQGIIEVGMHVGLRGLDQQPDALRQIHEVDFAYVKLGGAFVRELLASPGGVQLMVAVTETAIGMGMRVYIDDAEDPGTRRMVIEYGALPRAA